MPRRPSGPARCQTAVRSLPTTQAAAAIAPPVVARATRQDRTPLPGGLLLAPATGTGQLGAFVRRAVVVAPPRVSVRPSQQASGVGGPAVPEVARAGSAGRRPGGSSAAAVEADGPLVRRSLSGAAHSLFRSLLAGPPELPAGAGRQPAQPGFGNSVSGGITGMFDGPHSHQPVEPAVIRRFRQPGSDPDPHSGDQPAADASPAMRARDFDELIDRIVAKLEHRVLEDLERRGRRGIPGVF
ncbi:MAG: hypothetical protein ACJ74U_07730 [Jatrophihabitantaceae bacterium]